jgi:hypothetical protein
LSLHFIVRFEPLPGKEAAFREELLRVDEPWRRRPQMRGAPDPEERGVTDSRATRTSTNPRRVIGLDEFHQSLASHRETLSA